MIFRAKENSYISTEAGRMRETASALEQKDHAMNRGTGGELPDE